jgi:hypothetical protein
MQSLIDAIDDQVRHPADRPGHRGDDDAKN